MESSKLNTFLSNYIVGKKEIHIQIARVCVGCNFGVDVIVQYV